MPPPARMKARHAGDHLQASEVIRGHQRSSEVIRGHQRSSEVIGGHRGHHEVIRGVKVRHAGDNLQARRSALVRVGNRVRGRDGARAQVGTRLGRCLLADCARRPSSRARESSSPPASNSRAACKTSACCAPCHRGTGSIRAAPAVTPPSEPISEHSEAVSR